VETIHKTLRLPADIVAMVIGKAKKENRSFGNCVITILKEYFKKEK